jgi:chromate reductase
MTAYKVGYLVGSLSSRSINRELSRVLIRLAPDDLEFSEIPIGNLPLYSQDYDDDFPPEARALKEAIAGSDAILFVTPEYNRSIPGGLKNAIDWASRPHGRNAFTGKPTAVIGASIGKVGTAAAQQHLKGVMNYSDAVLMNQPEAYIHFNEDAYSADGSVSDPALAKVLSGYMAAFRDFVVRVTTAGTAEAEPVAVRRS